MDTKKNKVVIIGAGSVGATIAYNLFLRGSVNEVALIDMNHEKAIAEAEDIRQGIPLGSSINVYAAEMDTCEDAEIVILTAGAKQKPGETRVALLDRNLAITKSIAGSLSSTRFNGILLIVSNPVDILTYVAWKVSGYSVERVIGSGTVLDTSRLRNFLGEKCDVSPHSIHGYVLGEHGNTSFPAWSTISIGGLLLAQYFSARKDLQVLLPQIKEEAKTYVREAAYTIIKGKGSTYYAIAQAVGVIVDSIIHNERRILPVSTIRTDFSEFSDMAYSYPTIIGKSGVVHQLHCQLTDEEQNELKESVKFIASNIQKIL